MNVDFRMELAYVLHDSGDDEEARAELRRARNAAPVGWPRYAEVEELLKKWKKKPPEEEKKK